jgi:transcriptional regulator with XRE-family HTH domain
MSEFSDWLDTELSKRNWTRADLAKAAGISQSSLSLIYSGNRKPGNDLCESIARALKLPPEEVFRRAGLLPPKRDNPWFPRFETIIEELSEEDIEDLYAIALAKLERQAAKKRRLKTT